MGMRSPRRTPGSPAQGFRVRKRSPQNFWLQYQWGLSQGKNLLEPKQSLLQTSYMDSPPQTHSRWLQHWAGGLKGTKAIQAETEVSGIGARRCYHPFAEPSADRAGSLVPYLRFYQPG